MQDLKRNIKAPFTIASKIRPRVKKMEKQFKTDERYLAMPGKSTTLTDTATTFTENYHSGDNGDRSNTGYDFIPVDDCFIDLEIVPPANALPNFIGSY